MEEVPKAVTPRVAHQGNPVIECSPSIKFIAPIGPSWDAPMTSGVTLSPTA